MKEYEIITVGFSLFALILSIISIILTHRNSKKQIEMEKKQSELAEKQLELIKEEEKTKNRAILKVWLDGSGSNINLFIRNVSKATAFNVDIKVIGKEGKDSPLLEDDYKGKFPLTKLDPDDEIYLAFLLDGGTGYIFNSICTWENQDKSHGKKETLLSW